MLVHPAGQGRTLVVGPTRNTVKLQGAESGGVGVVEMEFAPGFPGPPPHRHAGVDHVWYLLAGGLEILLGERTLRLTAGDFAFVPRGLVHAFANGGDRPATLLQVDTPHALDGYFTDLAEAFPAGTTLDPAVIAEIQRRHDTTPLDGVAGWI
ncbi:cupin domain-containing protein [Actinomadura rupiterrae]|uniref:cupin domain-containing protein n=1 Tax=Actinomadura rupiterrae TaxID=559627 RepID=UPI0020A4B2A7|nr:cupin domain-containing protein [Actinomadura rupiterrae]MCP2341596.1 quercetin dioxygenase-like cupin family protein [Actinomadura rupiterrae]